MKELSIEEKAKCYDKTLERYKAKQEYASKEVHKFIEYIFPELKESEGEDERIRKGLIRAFKSLNTLEVWNGIKRSDILAWLEKQGEQYPKFRIGDTIKKKSTSDIVTISEIDLKNKEYRLSNTGFIPFKYEHLWELVEQKSADKVEPKFHEGEWVFIEEVKGYNNGPFQIKTVDSFGYSFDEYHTIPFMYEDLLSKWTIQDAKDGDVLVYEGEIFMIKSYVLWHKIVYHYCYDGKILHRYSIYDSWKREDFDKVHPATKEQRDLLFQKMEEAGYKWNADKKELKKIEEPENFKNQVMSEITDLVEYYITQKPAEWSEEDEDMLDEICSNIKFAAKNRASLSVNFAHKQIDWLKSLKERVQPQSTT